jgi:hypothetical protein
MCPTDSLYETGTIMADRNGLKFVGLLFASVTMAVMLTTAFVVKGHADGRYTLEGAQTTVVQLAE